MKTRLFAFAALALALAACNNDNETQNNNGPVAARFISDITSATRASGTTWDDGDCIGITGAGYNNIPYVTERNGNFAPKSTTIYYNDMNGHTFSAYYPYKDDSELTEGKIIATADAAAQQNQPSIDFLFASGAEGDTHNPEVKFTDKTDMGGEDNSFHHRMSQITLTFEAGDGVDFSVVKPESYTLGGVKLTGTFNTADGTAAADDGAPAESLSIKLTDGNLTSSVILFPQTATSLPLSVMFNNNEYNATLTASEGRLQAGNNYFYTVRINNIGLEVSGATIAAWNDVPADGDVNADL